jgi:hypothetical protein
MAQKKWLTQANRFNFRHIKQPSHKVYLDPATFGIGNTRVTIPAMQGADGEAITFNQNYLMVPNIEATADGKNALKGWSWRNQADGDMWVWNIPEAKRYVSDLSQRTITNSMRNLSVSSDPRTRGAANDKQWNPHGTRYYKDAFIKDFTKVFYDLATSNIGLDLDISLDQNKIEKMGLQYPDDTSSYLKISPVFNFNTLTTDAKKLLEIDSRTKKSKLFKLYNNTRASQDNFDLNISNMLFLDKKVARRVKKYGPLFTGIGVPTSAFQKDASLKNAIIWANPKNEYSYGYLDVAVAKDNICEASNLVLSSSISCAYLKKNYLLKSQNTNLQTEDVVGPDSKTVLCSIRDFTNDEMFDGDLSKTSIVVEVNNDKAKRTIPKHAYNFFTSIYRLPRYTGDSALSSIYDFISYFNKYTTPTAMQTYTPLPYDTTRLVGTCNIPVLSLTNCQVYYKGYNSDSSSLNQNNFGLKLNGTDIPVDTKKSSRIPVLYVRSRIIVSLDALALNLRGQPFESFYEDYFVPKSGRHYQHPIVVKQMDGSQKNSTFMEVILERVFDIRTYKGGKILSTLNQIDKRINDLKQGKKIDKISIPALKPILAVAKTPKIPTIKIPPIIGLLPGQAKIPGASAPPNLPFIPNFPVTPSTPSTQATPETPVNVYQYVLDAKGEEASDLLKNVLDFSKVSIPSEQDKLFLTEFVEMMNQMVSGGFIPQEAIKPIVENIIENDERSMPEIQKANQTASQVAQAASQAASQAAIIGGFGGRGSAASSASASSNTTSASQMAQISQISPLIGGGNTSGRGGPMLDMSRVKLYGWPLSSAVLLPPQQPVRVRVDLVKQYNIDKAGDAQVPFRINEVIFGEILKEEFPKLQTMDQRDVPKEDATGVDTPPLPQEALPELPPPPTELPASDELASDEIKGTQEIPDGGNIVPMEGDLSAATEEKKTPWGWIVAGVATAGVAGAVIWNMNKNKKS